MKIFITDQQKIEPEHLHGTTHNGRDRIKAILMASKGWSSSHDRSGFTSHIYFLIGDMRCGRRIARQSQRVDKLEQIDGGDYSTAPSPYHTAVPAGE